VLVCEHASNHIPAEYGALGLPPERLGQHIALDIGSAGLTHHLARRLDAIAFLGTYSRLLIDLNRPLESPQSISLRSEDVDIPGNAGIDRGERRRRADCMFTPFQNAVATHLDQRAAAGRRTMLVTIHSFTPVFLGVPRPWHIGVLHGKSDVLANAILRELQAEGDLNVALNVPYIVSRDDDYAVPIHGDDRDIPVALIEVRQDLLASAWAQEEMAVRLARIMEKLLETAL
jgi:predicted N-formylglutamate amidohydrolase